MHFCILVTLSVCVCVCVSVCVCVLACYPYVFSIDRSGKENLTFQEDLQLQHFITFLLQVHI